PAPFRCSPDTAMSRSFQPDDRRPVFNASASGRTQGRLGDTTHGAVPAGAARLGHVNSGTPVVSAEDVTRRYGEGETAVDALRGAHRRECRSGGQERRVAIARALVSKPTVVLADEPTGNLDSTTSHEILALLRAATEDFGQTTVMVTHDAGAAAIADRILFLA